MKSCQFKIATPQDEAERTTKTTVDTIHFTRDEARSWKIDTFQREVKINEKVRQLATKIKEDGGVIPGILTLGILNGDKKNPHVIDGQHRREAFFISDCGEGFADVRFLFCDSLAEMGREFVNLNSALVRMRPDDNLRALEGCHPLLAKIRKSLPFVGYDMVRRGPRTPIVSMSAMLRCWRSSSSEVPTPSGGPAAVSLAEELIEDEVLTLIRFMNVAFTAWGRDPEYYRLWTNLPLTICMWLYRRLVVNPYSSKTKRLTDDIFSKALMSLSANSLFLDWLVGRNMGDRDRGPCYERIKALLSARLHQDTGVKHMLPAPAWAHGGKR